MLHLSRCKQRSFNLSELHEILFRKWKEYQILGGYVVRIDSLLLPCTESSTLKQLNCMYQLLYNGVEEVLHGTLEFKAYSLVQMSQYDNLLDLLTLVRPSRAAYIPVWKFTQNGSSSVNSSYKFINKGGLICPFYKVIWKAVALEKANVLLWLALKNRLHRGEVLAWKGWAASAGCLHYGSNSETTLHIFLMRTLLILYVSMLFCIFRKLCILERLKQVTIYNFGCLKNNY